MSVVINLGNAAANTATFSAVDTLTSGTGDDTIVLTGPINNASIDLGAGNDTLTFGNFANSATVANVETITGGTGADTVTLGTVLTTAMQSTSAPAPTSSPSPQAATPEPSATSTP